MPRLLLSLLLLLALSVLGCSSDPTPAQQTPQAGARAMESAKPDDKEKVKVHEVETDALRLTSSGGPANVLTQTQAGGTVSSAPLQVLLEGQTRLVWTDVPQILSHKEIRTRRGTATVDGELLLLPGPETADVVVFTIPAPPPTGVLTLALPLGTAQPDQDLRLRVAGAGTVAVQWAPGYVPAHGLTLPDTLYANGLYLFTSTGSAWLLAAMPARAAVLPPSTERMP